MEGKSVPIIMQTAVINVIDITICRIILDADPQNVQKRVDLRTDVDLPLGEHTVSQVTNAIHGLFW
jgi:hypothetical protein